MRILKAAIVVLTVVLSQTAFGQANFAFDVTEHDFGTVPAGKDTLWHSFKFVNTGNEPLMISDVRTSCDCTLAEWPKEAVQPGKSGVIRGGFKIDGKNGRFEKSVIIFANTAPAMTTLDLKGNVLPPGQK